MDKLDFIQIKISCASKNNINIVKGNPLKSNKHLQIKIQIFKELLQLNNKRAITKDLNQIFLQRQTNDQKPHEKVLNSINNYRTTNQNCGEIPVPTHQDVYNRGVGGEIINVGKGMEKLENLYIASGNIKGCSHCGKQFASFLKN